MTKNDLERTIRILEEKNRRLNEEERLKRIQENRRKEQYEEYEEDKEIEKLKLHREIRKWADEFVGTDIFHNLLDYYDKIEIFGGEWGHEIDGDSYGCWSYINIEEYGRLEYNAGYKWMGVSTRFLIDESSIQRLNYKYLKDLYEFLNSGDVYGHLKRGVEEMLDNPLLLMFNDGKRKNDESKII